MITVSLDVINVNYKGSN